MTQILELFFYYKINMRDEWLDVKINNYGTVENFLKYFR